MAKEKKDLRKELEDFRYSFGLKQKILCSAEESKTYNQLLKNGQPLPKGIYRSDFTVLYDEYEFYTVYDPELTETETAEYLKFQKLSMLKTIKNCVVFFTVLTVIGLVAALYIALL